jgi:hypothetical protein
MAPGHSEKPLLLYLGRRGSRRPSLPLSASDILEEDGRCQNPECIWGPTSIRPLEIAHITPWRQVYAWTFEPHDRRNLIALCRPCHSQLDNGVIPRAAVRTWNTRCRNWTPWPKTPRTPTSSRRLQTSDPDACYGAVHGHSRRTAGRILFDARLASRDRGDLMRQAKSLRYVYHFDQAARVLDELRERFRDDMMRSFVLYERAQIMFMTNRDTMDGIESGLRLMRSSQSSVPQGEWLREMLTRHATLDFLARLEDSESARFAVNADNARDLDHLSMTLEDPAVARRFLDVLVTRAEWDAISGNLTAALQKSAIVMALADASVTEDADSFLPRAYAALGHARQQEYFTTSNRGALYGVLIAYSASMSLFDSLHVTGNKARCMSSYAEALTLLGRHDLACAVISERVEEDIYWNNRSEIMRVEQIRSRLRDRKALL